MASISFSNLAAQVDLEKLQEKTETTPEAVEPKVPPFTHNSMRSYTDERDELEFKLADARGTQKQLQVHVKALNDKLQAARELEEVAAADDSGVGRADLQKARQLIESCSKKAADLEARLVEAKRSVHYFETQLKGFPHAEQQAELRRIQLRARVR